MKVRLTKLTRKEKLLFLAPALVFVALFWRMTLGSGDRLERAERSYAGWGAIDCGVAHSETEDNNLMSTDREKVDGCVVAAFKAKQPFRARYDEFSDVGTPQESKDSRGIAGNATGRIFFFDYSWNAFDLFRQAECPQPKIYPFGSSWFKKQDFYLGCGTCDHDDSYDRASCLLKPSWLTGLL